METNANILPKNTTEYQWNNHSSHFYKISTNNGLSFTNLVLENSQLCQLKEVLIPNAVHFIYPTNNDINILLKHEQEESILCRAKNTTLLIDNLKLDDQTTFEYSNNTEVSAFSFSYDFFENLQEDSYTKFLNKLFHKKLQTLTCLQHNANKDRIQSSIKILKSIDRSKGIDQRLIIEAFNELQYIYLKTYIDWHNEDILEKEDLKKIEQLPKIILAHKNKPVSVSELTNELNLSEEKINLGSEVVFNCSVSHLINKTKMEQAANELKNNSLDIAEIVYKNGFKNRRYFYKVFNKIFGCNPIEYIQSNGNLMV